MLSRAMARLWDLWPFVKKHVYHPQFQGSFSLKAVLPGLAPGFSYEGMEVSHGDEAGLAQRGPANDLASSGVFVGDFRGSAGMLTEEPVKLAAGGIKGPLLLL